MLGPSYFVRASVYAGLNVNLFFTALIEIAHQPTDIE